MIQASKMTKLVFALIALVGITVNSYGQTTPAKKIAPPLTVQIPAGSKALKGTAKAALVKADGTLDMRYKANREAAKAKPKLKKDGTPDMRYNRNKKQ